jgi:hypothetical protein
LVPLEITVYNKVLIEKIHAGTLFVTVSLGETKGTIFLGISC